VDCTIHTKVVKEAYAVDSRIFSPDYDYLNVKEFANDYHFRFRIRVGCS